MRRKVESVGFFEMMLDVRASELAFHAREYCSRRHMRFVDVIGLDLEKLHTSRECDP